ncbi:hypothetical protein [Sinosporangium siamense]|uniref:Uncharacterized protein n=1 Tax=Sinosporangium siamense TaxID=1367973 RepID=A0A919REZ6_9ACTN|nr:hypothetical protein [Sinosporangium siamense]GII91580.1 hypothetical protein Ssi02_18110 [Sinosporangium siamense]
MRLPSDRIGVLVSLPGNDPALAEAAASAGADGLKVHINIEHRASGTAFGSLDQEADRLRAVLAVGLPTGLVVGGAGTVSPGETRSASVMGFDYFDVYASHAPAGYVADCGEVTPMVALGPADGPADAAALVAAGVRALEMSTLDPALYGTALSLGTLARVSAVRGAVGVPLVVPAQHRLTPADLPALVEAGASAVLLGAVVTGPTPEGIAAAVKAFRGAL